MQLLESRLINTSLLVQNDGRIEGLPANPRFIKSDRFDKLKASIKSDASHLYTNELKVYEHEGKFVVISGNMRLRACKQLGIKEVPCKIIPQDWTLEQIKKEAIVSNVEAGEWDNETLANEWSDLPLEDWGLYLGGFDSSNEFEDTIEDELKQEDNTKTEACICPTCNQPIHTTQTPF